MVSDRVRDDGFPSASSSRPSELHPDDISISGMESVVACTTGYEGDEKSRLIKMINCSGGFYVGSLRKGSTTHLVCKAFSGKKYEMAKRFGIHIINHQWFEDCIDAGRRLPEKSYTSFSGADVGTVSWKLPKHKRDSVGCRKSDAPEIGKSNYYLSASCFPDENFSKNKRNHKDSAMPDKPYILDIISDSECSDQDLEALLQYNSKKRDKGKQKLTKSQSFKYKMPKKCTRRPSPSPLQPSKSNSKGSRNLQSCNILSHMCISDESDTEMRPKTRGTYHDVVVEDDQISPNVENLDCELAEGSSTRPSRRSRRSKERQLSLSKFVSIEPRGKRNLMNIQKVCRSTSTIESTGHVTMDRSKFHSTSVGATSNGRIPNDESPVFSVRSGASCGVNIEKVEESPIACTLVPSDIVCVICHTDKISSAEGILMCGHKFCYPCIKKWASEVASKNPTCPLCKTSFDMITKKQLVAGPNGEESSFEESIILLEGKEDRDLRQVAENIARPTCIMCGIGDMEEMLMVCSECGARSAHSFCLDPPLPPPDVNTLWFCGRCSQRRRVDTSWWYQLHDIQRLGD